jgi:hypothetical protein
MAGVTFRIARKYVPVVAAATVIGMVQFGPAGLRDAIASVDNISDLIEQIAARVAEIASRVGDVVGADRDGFGSSDSADGYGPAGRWDGAKLFTAISDRFEGQDGPTGSDQSMPGGADHSNGGGLFAALSGNRGGHEGQQGGGTQSFGAPKENGVQTNGARGDDEVFPGPPTGEGKGLQTNHGGGGDGSGPGNSPFKGSWPGNLNFPGPQKPSSFDPTNPAAGLPVENVQDTDSPLDPTELLPGGPSDPPVAAVSPGEVPTHGPDSGNPLPSLGPDVVLPPTDAARTPDPNGGGGNDVAAVPQPASLVVLMIGLVAVGLVQRRRVA